MKNTSLLLLLCSLGSLICMNNPSSNKEATPFEQMQKEREARLEQARKDLWDGLATKNAELVRQALAAGATPREATPTVENPYIELPYTPEILAIIKEHALDSYTGGI